MPGFSRHDLLPCLVWVLMLLGVQPWPGQDGSGVAGKFILVLLCAIAALLLLPGKASLIVPSAIAALLLYAAFCGLASLFTSGSPFVALARAARIAIGVGTPILLIPHLVRSPLKLAQWHLVGHVVIGATVALGALVRPGRAYHGLDPESSSPDAGQRLQGLILPLTPSRVGEVGAIVLALALLLLLYRHLTWPPAMLCVALGSWLLIGSNSRTPALAATLCIVLAFTLTARQRASRIGLGIVGSGMVLAGMFAGAVLTWLGRGQSSEQLTTLTGRTSAWQFIRLAELSSMQRWLGHGLGDKSVLMRRSDGAFGPMAIDSTWYSLYWESGYVGLTIVAGALALAWWAVLRCPASGAKAVSVFLLLYATLATITETGLSDLSSLTMHLLAAVTIATVHRTEPPGEKEAD
ncbi:O-antigen ligase family protein [Mobilicoccus sp.]|uniref:O-antigen ligase family protein n=1 Tax=Mobilicoccus sp. TaxID=2034349 RepID=UPI0028ADFBF1|nr:O-antigen ligase family protein [Mobilicoccus sp.]